MVDHFLTQKQKEGNNFQYYRDNINHLDNISFTSSTQFGDRFEGGRWARMLSNYSLMENRINPRDYDYTTAPYKEKLGERPLQLPNRDIISHRVYTVLNIERKRPFKWYVSSTNPEATTRKEQAAMAQIKQMFADYIKQYATQQSPEITDHFISQVRKYLSRRNTEPVEMLGQQIINHLIVEQDLEARFMRGLRHGLVGGMEVYHITEVNGEPTLFPVNGMFFDRDRSTQSEFVEDSEWQVHELRLTPSEVIQLFGNELNKEEKRQIYEMYHGVDPNSGYGFYEEFAEYYGKIRVLHCVWRGFRKIGRLRFFNPQTGGEDIKLVDENYSLNKQMGDIALEWDWISEIHEGYKIGQDMYKRCRPVPNQHKDVDALHKQPMPYVGIEYSFEGGDIVSMVDRGRPFQYMYNIYSFRKDRAVASDKGRKVFLPLQTIPRALGIDMKKFEHNLDVSTIQYVDLLQDGNASMRNIGEMIKEVDLSNPTDINTYIKLCEYYDEICGRRMGVPPQLEGVIQERESVRNVSAILNSSGNVLGYYFQKHDLAKRNALRQLLNQAIVSYRTNPKKKLAFIMDEMSNNVLESDLSMLDGASLGVFLSNSEQMTAAQEALTEIAMAAVNSQLIHPSATADIFMAQSPAELKELLKEAEDAFQEQQLQREKARLDTERAIEEERRRTKEYEIKLETDKEVTIQREKAQADLRKQALLALGFSEDDDINNNRVPDVIDYLKMMIEGKSLELKEQELKIKKKESNNSSKR